MWVPIEVYIGLDKVIGFKSLISKENMTLISLSQPK